ncbi:MAG TPA: sugar transferase [Candidatus Paceibacterota bacterium]
MMIQSKKESMILLVGDIVVFIFSLWLSLALRAGAFPSSEIFFSNLAPFLILSIAWVASFFIAGLYEKQKIAQRRRLPELLLKTQLFNSLVAIIFFYFIPYFGVAPKIILFIYIILSLALSFLWRVYALSNLVSKRREKAMLIAGGNDANEVLHEINNNPRYPFEITSVIEPDAQSNIDFEKDIVEKMRAEHISIVILDSRDEKVAPILPHLYDLAFVKIQFMDFYALYEELFDRLPVSLLNYSWFLENISLAPHTLYDALKRVMDIVSSIIILTVVAVICVPVWLILRLEGVKRLWSFQERVGQYGKTIRLMKFPSMLFDDGGIWQGKENKVTKFGAFLRKIRLDEFPQAWNLLRGDVSLIGPRSEFPNAVGEYTKAISYYNLRYIIKPGLSGWAQIYGEHPHHGVDIEATKNKLSYDLFYIKNRSFVLDIIIALKTIKTILSREGL